MKFIPTELQDAFIVEIERIEDDRGYFARSWCRREFESNGLKAAVVQANMSYNRRRGTLRGLHYQNSPHAETKLVRCVRGSIYDVIVDLRPDSPTLRKWIGVHLSDDNYRMLYVPEGFAHGFVTLEDDTEITYQVTEYYSPHAEAGVRFDDPAIGVQWPIEPNVVSEKDLSWPALEVTR